MEAVGYDICQRQRKWASRKICLEEYFTDFWNVVATEEKNGYFAEILSKSDSQVNVFKLMNERLDKREIKVLEEVCSIDKLSVKDEPIKFDVKVVKVKPALYDKCEVSPRGSHLETLKNLDSSTEYTTKLKYRSHIWPTMETKPSSNLTAGNEFLLTTRVYHPFIHQPGVRIKQPPRCSHEMVVLGQQTLDVLRDKIDCPSDLSVPGDLSENPDKKFTKRAKDIYKSGFIFIEDTFYNDFRCPENIDYSEVIRTWAAGRDMGPFQAALMEKTRFKDLTLRLGYPYVYQHQGNCEHLVVFSDARLLHKSDPMSISQYPLLRSLSSSNAVYCMVCGIYVARWVTLESDRFPHDPGYFCQRCFRMYNYIDKQKVGNFKAFPFFGKP